MHCLKRGMLKNKLIFINCNSLPAILLIILSCAQRQTWGSRWISVATGRDQPDAAQRMEGHTQQQECCRPSCSSLRALAAPSASTNPFLTKPTQAAAGEIPPHSSTAALAPSPQHPHTVQIQSILSPGVFPISTQPAEHTLHLEMPDLPCRQLGCSCHTLGKGHCASLPLPSTQCPLPQQSSNPLWFFQQEWHLC